MPYIFKVQTFYDQYVGKEMLEHHMHLTQALASKLLLVVL